MNFGEKYIRRNQLLNLNQWEGCYHIKVKDTNDSRFILSNAALHFKLKALSGGNLGALLV